MTTLDNVRPALAVYNAPYRSTGDSENLRKSFLGQVLFRTQSAYLSYFIIRQFWVGVKYAATIIEPAFLQHVVRVIFLCAKKKMSRAHAWSIIALVKNTKAAGHRPICKFIGELMCAEYSTPASQIPVTMTCQSTSPKPARAKFWSVDGYRAILIYLCPERSFWRDATTLLVALATTVAALAAPQVGGLSRELTAAGSTVACYSDLSHDSYSLLVSGLVRLVQGLTALFGPFVFYHRFLTQGV